MGVEAFMEDRMYFESICRQFPRVLKNLSAILDKGDTYATAKKFEVEVLLQARLAPDQFNLIRQVQIACDTAKLAAVRLTGKESPSFEDNEKTLVEVKDRIQKTISYLEGLTVADFEGARERKITQPRWENKWMKGHDYFVEHVTPNFYFHVTTAYSILRHNGVDVGKKDYLGALSYQMN